MRPLILFFLLVTTAVFAQDADLPDAEDLLARYRASLGEPARLASLKTMRCHGKVSWDDLEDSGFLTEVYGGLKRARSTTEFAIFGTYEYGTNGRIVWEKNPLGITIREGWDACQYMRELGLMQHVDWREMYNKARVIGMKEIDGVDCWELHLFPKMLVEASEKVTAQSPPPDVWYLDAGTFLLKRLHAKSIGLFDEPIEIRIDMDDWRVADGVRYPHRLDMRISKFTMNIEFQSFEHNVDVPAGYFEPDDDVLAEAARLKDPEERARDAAIRIETLDTRHIASIRVTCKHDQMQKTLAVLLPEVMHTALSTGATMAGPPLVRYHMWGDTLDIEAAIPVTEPVQAKGRVVAETLPAGQAIVTWHVGPYERLGDTHQKITAFLEANDLEKRGAAWEEYWTDPGMEPDPAKWRTRVVWPVKEKKAGD